MDCLAAIMVLICPMSTMIKNVTLAYIVTYNY